MIYFENASRGLEGFNTHVMSWTTCLSLSNFYDRDFYFDCELPSSTPPDFASQPAFADKFRILMESPRSLVSELIVTPTRRVLEIDRSSKKEKISFELLYSRFATTEEMKRRFEGTIIWDSFGVGRIAQTREELAGYDLIEWTHSKMAHPSIFYFLPRDEKMALLESVRIVYLNGIEKLARKIGDEIGAHNAVHIRLGDYLQNFGSDGYAINPEKFAAYVRLIFPDSNLPVLIATDGLQDKEVFDKIFAGYRTIFIDELVFDNYLKGFGDLEFTDFNVLTIINQLLCASAQAFIGTYRSTFTGIIHRLRQERYSLTDFEFFPDERVQRLLNGAGRLAPDRSGFFEWNRYSAFSENHLSMAWMREWNHQLSAIDL